MDDPNPHTSQDRIGIRSILQYVINCSPRCMNYNGCASCPGNRMVDISDSGYLKLNTCPKQSFTADREDLLLILRREEANGYSPEAKRAIVDVAEDLRRQIEEDRDKRRVEEGDLASVVK